MKNQVLTLTEKVLRHMLHKAGGHQVGGVLLTGDPGIGKTSFVRLFSMLIGVEAVVIEVPHITEEHLINIPFIVFTPQGGTKTGVSQMSHDYKLVLAQSNLYTQLAQVKQMSDEQYKQYITKAPPFIQQLYQALGGTTDTIPPAIEAARKQVRSILFLDEFYRQTSTRIRNILRGILNNRIGMHEIPNDVYVLYASNMKDTGLEEIPSNQQFTAIKYKTPLAKDWFDWLVAKYSVDHGVQLNEEVMKKFKKTLKDEHLSHTDVVRDVRVSPRRWEQLLLYVNSSIPVESHDEARALLTNVKNNFINYQTGEHSDLAEKVVKAVSELIGETSRVKIEPGDVQETHEWRSTVEHLLKAQVKLGNVRQHVPVISGPPGIGKTREMQILANKYNLRLIDIDISEYFAEDVIGLPLPANTEHEDISVDFSLPKLYQHIMNVLHKKDEQYREMLEKKGDKAALQKYDEQKYKYLIFFDEINRTDEKTFNAFRRVILEKSFGPSSKEGGKELKLPEDAIVIAAMNPEGAGTTEFTHHFRDVVDIVPASANWQSFLRWLQSREYPGALEGVQPAAINVINAFAQKFSSRSDKYRTDTAPFHLDVGTELYISPREYGDMVSTLVRELDANVKRVLHDPQATENEVRETVYDTTGDAMEDSLEFIFNKHGVDNDEFIAQMKTWVNSLPDDTFGGLTSKKVKTSKTLSSQLKNYLEGHDITKMPNDVHIVNANNSVNNTQFLDEVRAALMAEITDDAAARKYILDEDHPKVELDGDTIKMNSKEKVSLITNFVLGLLYTLHIHDFQNDRIMMVGKSLSSAISSALSDLLKKGKIDEDYKMELSAAIAQLRSDVQDLVSEL